MLIGLTMVSLLSSIMVVSGTSKLTIRVVFLILGYISVSLIFIYMDYTFIGLTYIVVYAGALAIIFVFIVMLLPTRETEKGTGNILKMVLGSIIIIATITQITEIDMYPSQLLEPYPKTDMYNMGMSLYNLYPIVLILCGVLLWAIMIGVLDILK